MAVLSDYARKKKIEYFLKGLPKDWHILEVGCATGWLGDHLRRQGYANYIGLDLVPPADILGNILDWERLGLKRASFDVVIAFEVVEHVDCFRELYEVLKPGGLLFLTSPVPHMDWFCRILESVGLNQKRTSRHSNLTYFRDIPLFKPVEVRTVGLAAQWGKFRKPCGTS